VPGVTALGNFIFDRREVTTHVIVQNGQTIMLSGIIQQDKFDDIRKVPLLGDIPLIGPLFRHVDKGVKNREMVVFLTPHVIENAQQLEQQMAQPRDVMRRVEQSLDAPPESPTTVPPEPPASQPDQNPPAGTAPVPSAQPPLPQADAPAPMTQPAPAPMTQPAPARTPPSAAPAQAPTTMPARGGPNEVAQSERLPAGPVVMQAGR
jgi:hypothetical protein